MTGSEDEEKAGIFPEEIRYVGAGFEVAEF